MRLTLVALALANVPAMHTQVDLTLGGSPATIQDEPAEGLPAHESARLANAPPLAPARRLVVLMARSMRCAPATGCAARGEPTEGVVHLVPDPVTEGYLSAR